MKKIFCLCISLILILLNFSGCSSTNSFITTLEIDNKVTTLDPQLANTAEDKLLVRNLYEGLLREDKDGKVVCGAAENYKISSDGLTYTFNLKKDLTWSNGTQLLAKDFVFAFERALNPVTKSPYVHLLSDVASYKANGNYQFIVKLKQKNSDFINTLCKPICMPCNEAFFNGTKGKYGLDINSVLTNGSFSLKKWVKDGEYSIKLIASENYKGDFISNASAVNISLGEIDERETRMEKEFLEFGFVDYTNANKVSEKVSYISNYDTAYLLLINKKGLLQSNEMLSAIEKSIDRDKIKTNLPSCFINASTILPPSIKLSGKSLSDKVNVNYLGFNATEAGEHYRNALKEYKNYNLSGLEITYYNDPNLKTLATTLAETWQQTINGYINIKQYDNSSEFNTAIVNKDYDFAIVPFTAKDADIYAYLNNLNFGESDYSPMLNALKTTNNELEKINSTRTILASIYNQKTIIPLVFSSTVFGASKKYNIPNINPNNGYIDFALVTLK